MSRYNTTQFQLPRENRIQENYYCFFSDTWSRVECWLIRVLLTCLCTMKIVSVTFAGKRIKQGIVSCVLLLLIILNYNWSLDFCYTAFRGRQALIYPASPPRLLVLWTGKT